MIGFGFNWVEPPFIPKENGESYKLLDKTPIELQTALYLVFKPCSPNGNLFRLKVF